MPLKASIVIPNYNQSQHLHKSLLSAYEQKLTYPNVEIVFVDDGSTDNSLEKAQELATQYIPKDFPIQILSKNNGGTASARNLGIQNAQGDIIFFLDADDQYGSHKVVKTMEVFQKYNALKPNSIGFIYSDYLEHFVNENKTRVMFKPSFNKFRLYNQCIVSTNSAVPKYVFDNIGLFDETIKGCEDYDMWLRIAFEGRYMGLHIASPLFIYNNHKDSKTNTSDMNQWAKEEAKARAKIEEYVSI